MLHNFVEQWLSSAGLRTRQATYHQKSLQLDCSPPLILRQLLPRAQQPRPLATLQAPHMTWKELETTAPQPPSKASKDFSHQQKPNRTGSKRKCLSHTDFSSRFAVNPSCLKTTRPLASNAQLSKHLQAKLACAAKHGHAAHSH